MNSPQNQASWLKGATWHWKGTSKRQIPREKKFLTLVFLFFVLLSKAIRLNECVSWIKMKNLLNIHLPLHLRHCPSDMTLGSSQARSAVFLLTRGEVCGTGEPINGSFIWHNGRIERKWTLRGKRSETNLLQCNTKPRWNCLRKWWHKIKSFTNSGNMHFRLS